MRHAKLFVLLIAAAALGSVAGCGSHAAQPGKLQVFPVEGRLVVSGRPAANARLAFHPVSKSELGAVYPVGITRPDGTFRLTTYTADDGAPEGEYVVTLLWPNDTIPVDECDIIDPAAHDRLYGLYTDATKSQLRATIRPESNQITIEATVGGRGWNLPRMRDSGDKRDRRE